MGINDQYMLGPDLLVAPVTVQGATKRQVTFPFPFPFPFSFP